jgi:hypothetical protein
VAGRAEEHRWACLPCRTGGPADSLPHALALERTHYYWACPYAEGISAEERARRLAWLALVRQRYGDTDAGPEEGDQDHVTG